MEDKLRDITTEDIALIASAVKECDDLKKYLIRVMNGMISCKNGFLSKTELIHLIESAEEELETPALEKLGIII